MKHYLGYDIGEIRESSGSIWVSTQSPQGELHEIETLSKYRGDLLGAVRSIIERWIASQ